MPYELVETRGGWMVKKKGGGFMSSTPLPKRRAMAQMKALYASESKSSMKKKKGTDTKTTIRSTANRAY
jgi:hypothetical protein